MKRLLTCLLLALPLVTLAATVAVAHRTDGRGSILLHDERGECPGEGATLVATFQGIVEGAIVTVKGCWLAAKTEEGVVVHIVFDNGATLTLPAGKFGKPTPPL